MGSSSQAAASLCPSQPQGRALDSLCPSPASSTSSDIAWCLQPHLHPVPHILPGTL